MSAMEKGEGLKIGLYLLMKRCKKQPTWGRGESKKLKKCVWSPGLFWPWRPVDAGLTLSYFFSRNDSDVHTYVYKRYKNLKKLSYESTGSQNRIACL